MKKGLTELVFVVDRSGSMGGLETDTIGGINATLGIAHDDVKARVDNPIDSLSYLVREVRYLP